MSTPTPSVAKSRKISSAIYIRVDNFRKIATHPVGVSLPAFVYRAIRLQSKSNNLVIAGASEELKSLWCNAIGIAAQFRNFAGYFDSTPVTDSL